jgi:hypothetical protein
VRLVDDDQFFGAEVNVALVADVGGHGLRRAAAKPARGDPTHRHGDSRGDREQNPSLSFPHKPSPVPGFAIAGG